MKIDHISHRMLDIGLEREKEREKNLKKYRMNKIHKIYDHDVNSNFCILKH